MMSRNKLELSILVISINHLMQIGFYHHQQMEDVAELDIIPTIFGNFCTLTIFCVVLVSNTYICLIQCKLLWYGFFIA